MVGDVIDTARRRLAEAAPQDAEAVRRLGGPVIAFSDEVKAAVDEIRAFLFTRMYRAPRIMAERTRVTAVIDDLFPLYMRRPELLPAAWQADIAAVPGATALARIVADYIAGMTDRFALQSHASLFGAGSPASAAAPSASMTGTLPPR
jgi:dGTPase